MKHIFATVLPVAEEDTHTVHSIQKSYISIIMTFFKHLDHTWLPGLHHVRVDNNARQIIISDFLGWKH